MPQTRNGDVTLQWDERGEGEPLLLVMGMGFSSRMWHRALEPLASRFRVITFDNRGIGGSTTPRRPFGIGDLAADALAVLDAAGEESAHVYGVSMGGLTVQELALTHPERVRSVVLGCTGAPEPAHYEPSALALLSRRIPRALLLRVYPKLIQGMHGPAADPVRVKEDLALIRCTRSPGWVVAEQHRAVSRYSSRDRVGALAVPTLVVHGDADRVVPCQRGEELAALIPGAELVVLPGAGHNYLADRGLEANAAVLDFLERQRSEVRR